MSALLGDEAGEIGICRQAGPWSLALLMTAEEPLRQCVGRHDQRVAQAQVALGGRQLLHAGAIGHLAGPLFHPRRVGVNILHRDQRPCSKGTFEGRTYLPAIADDADIEVVTHPLGLGGADHEGAEQTVERIGDALRLAAGAGTCAVPLAPGHAGPSRRRRDRVR